MNQAELFLHDVLAEPETLERVVERYGGAGSPLDDVPSGSARVRFVGMGSSRYASLPAAGLLRASGVDAVVERSSAAVTTPPSSELLVVCVSANGETPETVEAAERHRGTSRVVAVTNRPESALAHVADLVLSLEAGSERGGVACRGLVLPPPLVSVRSSRRWRCGCISGRCSTLLRRTISSSSI